MNGSYDPYPDFSPLYEPTSFSWWLFSKHARQQMAGKTLRSSAVAMVVAKRTTVSEAMRISNQFEE